jgi:subtilisin
MPDNNISETVNNVVSLTKQKNYILTTRSGISLQSAGLRLLSSKDLDQLIELSGIKVVDRIKPGEKILEALGRSEDEAVDTLVVSMEPERAEVLALTTPQLIITEAKPLIYGSNEMPFLHQVQLFSLAHEKKKQKFRIRVVGKDNNEPIPNVTVGLASEGLPVYDISDENGEVEIELITIDSSLPRFITATATHSYWDLLIQSPLITEQGINQIQMTSYTDTYPGFPEKFSFGWGTLLMGLDKMPKDINGAGIKIAIIDSGCDNSHPLLQHIKIGRDFTTNPENPVYSTWNIDSVGHGSHCAGIIAGRSTGGTMMKGFAPEAEVHILKVLRDPYQRGFALVFHALNYCIENDIDVVNMSLGAEFENHPEDLEKILSLAAQHGIACIAAAGNTSKQVLYPASSNQTLSVSAIGSLEHLQPDTYDSALIKKELVDEDAGIFSASFASFGPEVDVCAPGVGIISTVPGGFFKSDSGTSMAAPHVTGLAALLLAHHPLFHTQFRARNKQRVEALFGLIRSQCKSYSLDKNRQGVGLPQLGPVVTLSQTPETGEKIAPNLVGV